MSIVQYCKSSVRVYGTSSWFEGGDKINNNLKIKSLIPS